MATNSLDRKLGIGSAEGAARVSGKRMTIVGSQAMRPAVLAG